jgi:hypothetical protein
MEPKEYEINWKQKKLETKEYYRNWKHKNVKDIGTKRI